MNVGFTDGEGVEGRAVGDQVAHGINVGDRDGTFEGGDVGDRVGATVGDDDVGARVGALDTTMHSPYSIATPGVDAQPTLRATLFPKSVNKIWSPMNDDAMYPPTLLPRHFDSTAPVESPSR